MSAAVLFAGTIVFAINIVDSFIGGLGVSAENRLIWSPDMVGCSLFLISGHLAMVEMGGWGRRPRDLGWWIVFVNQTSGQAFPGGGIDAGKSGSIMIEVPAGQPSGDYYLNAQDSAGDYIAQSVVFHIAKRGGQARA